MTTHPTLHADLDADPKTVWKVLADIQAWPDWVPGLESAVLDGALLIGNGFTRRAGRGPASRGVLRAVERPRRLAWTEDGAWWRRAYAWEIAPREGGSTVHVESAVSGPGARWARWRGRDPVAEEQARLSAWLDALQRRVRQEVPCG